MKSRTTKAERYVELRVRDGLGSREAARQVNFAGGKASPHARQLYGNVTNIMKQPASCVWIRKRLAEAEADVRNLRRLAAACDLAEKLRVPT